MTLGGTLNKLAKNSQSAIRDGVYDIRSDFTRDRHSMARAIHARRQGACIISEIKFASPSLGIINKRGDHTGIAVEMASGGAAAISVLTQPHLFGGSPEYFADVRDTISIPMLMKDIILDGRQVDAAVRIGADCILLIQAIFDAGYASDMEGFISKAHGNDIQVLLEVHNRAELERALKTECDIIGVNNRNLDTLKVSLSVTKDVLAGYTDKRPAISESGINTPEDIAYLKECGASGFLVGTSIMKSDSIKGGVERLVRAL